MTLISTIIPVFNCQTLVTHAIDSALAQTYAKHEVIVVDDGSTDQTADVITKYGSRVKICHQQNGGPGSARNRGAAMATGEWLAFLDADDEWLPNKLAIQLGAADDVADLIYTDRLNFGDCEHVSSRQSDIGELPEGDILDHLLLDNCLTLSSILIRKKTFDQLGGFNEDRQLIGMEDWEFLLRYAAAGGRVKVCKDALTRYRWHPNKISYDYEQCRQGRLCVLEGALKLPRARQLGPRFARRARANVWSTAAWLIAEASPWKSSQWYLRSLSLWPWQPHAYKGIIKCCLGVR